MALKSLKELYDDMIWRFCRVADNQFRKDMIKVFRKQKRKTQTVVAEFESKDETVCSNCGLVKTDEDDWIQCDICDEWYDRICQNIDGEALKTIRDHGDWYCKKC